MLSVLVSTRAMTLYEMAIRTTLGEEVQKEELDAGWYGAETDHPSPTARNVREAGVNS